MRTIALLLAAQLADLAGYLLVGRPDDSVLQAVGADVPSAKLAGIGVVLVLVALLQRRRPVWSRRGALLATFAGLLGAASAIRVLVA